MPRNKRWNIEIIDVSEGAGGGYKEIVFEVKGKGAFSRLKYERGVHRVQRVPVTEASGRIHTSTATVAVLPEADEVDIDINPEDLRIDIFHSSGAGGQNVNKVATAVRLTHIPTGTVVVCQDERSQLRNRQKAMLVLRSRLLDAERRKQEEEIVEERRSQVGSGERAEKIRTYNYPQDRITDHRIGQNFHNLPGIMEGDLDDIIDALTAHDRVQQSGGRNSRRDPQASFNSSQREAGQSSRMSKTPLSKAKSCCGMLLQISRAQLFLDLNKSWIRKRELYFGNGSSAGCRVSRWPILSAAGNFSDWISTLIAGC